jgi:ferrochelatase
MATDVTMPADAYGVLLVNLGSPQVPTRRGVARFLREFLLDPRVVELPRPLWWCILNGLVIPLRAARVARAYQSIWMPDGSPLRVYTERLAAAVAGCFPPQDGVPRILVAAAMTYGGPAIAEQVASLRAAGARRILLIPLFPQYSATSTGAVYDVVARLIQTARDIPDIQVVKSYATFPPYIAALAASVRRHWNSQGCGQRLLMSFHGIPQVCAERGDPYPSECRATALALAEALELADADWEMAYQSRFGRQQWLQPYTADTLRMLAESGITSVDVICPAFATDGLETLVEIAEENGELFRGAGGERLALIPCLNDSESHATALKMLIERKFFFGVAE